ncbi:MAG TPA: DNA topoisomerase IV subunit B [Alphaproteobacteria bacterium]|jgi:topoisomerase-4 subunit B|nr:DNA topoisomerase IV subunit B [Alphaproteobacteria bacterium]
MSDLFQSTARQAKPAGDSYSAHDIEVLEGLEPVRRRPGMYIGGTDERALHHLVAELLDNGMDEAVAGHASRIELELAADGTVSVRDNGRGIPVDEHPKYPGKSALEVIMTTLHSGGKFSGKAYETSGGLHGVGISVVNALSDRMVVEVALDRQLFRQRYSRGVPQEKLQTLGSIQNRRGTAVSFHPDPEIFGADAHMSPARLYRMARSKAYLQRGVEIRWICDPVLLPADGKVPAEETFKFPNGLIDFLDSELDGRPCLTPVPFTGLVDLPGNQGKVEWAVAWPDDEEGLVHSYCNTIPTFQGGTHEQGLRSALTRGLKAYGELIANKRAAQLTADDVMAGIAALLSIFIREPQFQGQTKERLASAEATRLVEQAMKDHFDHWLTGNPAASKSLLDRLIDKAEDRLRKKDSKDMLRKSATRKLRLPGKLADCTSSTPEGTEIFIVEGDSAGGSAKQARNRDTQAILPLRGKILNVASASLDKMRGNQEIQDLILALGGGSGRDFSCEKMRYERVIIMTDADVDGAHIASLLITFFYREMLPMLRDGRLFLAMPPLYRIVQGNNAIYARDDADKERILKEAEGKRGKIEISRFKGLGEMPAAQLRDTTMDPKKRTLIRVELAVDEDGLSDTANLVDRLMGRNAEPRFRFIQENARFIRDLDIDV